MLIQISITLLAYCITEFLSKYTPLNFSGDKDLPAESAVSTGRGSQADYGASLENWFSSESMGSNPIPGATFSELSYLWDLLGIPVFISLITQTS